MVVRAVSFLLLMSVVLFIGCSGEIKVSDDDLKSMTGGELKETVAVSGKVTVGGAPAGNVRIYAYTTEGGMTPVAETSTNGDGTYCWTTYKNCDGMPPGSYKLTFINVGKEGRGKQSENPEDLFKGKYNDPSKSEFTLDVAAGSSAQIDVNYALE